MEIVLAADAGEFEGAFHHAQRRVAVAVHDAVAEGAVVGADAQAALEPDGFEHEGREFFLDAPQFGGVLVVVVFLDGEFFGIGVIAGVHAHHFHPFDGFHGGFGLEMDVGHDGHEAALLAQFGHDVFADWPRL